MPIRVRSRAAAPARDPSPMTEPTDSHVYNLPDIESKDSFRTVVKKLSV